jgi:Kef-type K+ transport system membrane component KefB
VLGWAHPHAFLQTLSQLGLAVLFFVAGSEIEFAVFRGRTGRNAIFGWLVSIGIGVGLGWLIAPGEEAIIIGIALCSTALGTILPILRDAGELKTPFGLSASAVGAIGEFGPLIAISIFLGSRQPDVSALVLLLFAIIAGLAIWLAFTVPQGAMHRFVNSSLHTSGQFAIRVVLLIIAALLSLSIFLDLDFLLGAFTAGIVWRLIMRDAAPTDRAAVESKVEAVAFGFLVPVFFLYTGLTFDLDSLLAQPILFLLLPVVLVVFLIVRGLPSTFAAPEHSPFRERASLALLGSTALPIVVAVTAIGVDEKILSSSSAALLVGGAMLSVLLFPLLAMALLGDRRVRAVEPIEDDLA